MNMPFSWKNVFLFRLFSTMVREMDLHGERDGDKEGDGNGEGDGDGE